MDSTEVNIPTTVEDPHYRYKMPKIQIAHQGSGNGIKTKWINLQKVSDALKVPTEYPIKFIGKELGSNVEIKKDVYLINGSHSEEDMQKILDKFIKKYVLCPKCKVPEIYGKITVKKKKNEITCVCRACGTTSKLDSAHEFASYIKRFPPPLDEEDTTGGKESKKVEKKVVTLDKTLIKNIKECADALKKGVKNELEEAQNIEFIQKLFTQYNFSNEIKFYVFANGIFDDNVYTKTFEKRLGIMKHFILEENSGNYEEALFFFLVGISDFIFQRQKGKNLKYLSSMMYYFYKEDIITEDFWNDLAINKKMKFSSKLCNSDTETKFFSAVAEFTKWIESGPYEGEELKKEEEDEVVDIDNI